MWFTWDFRKIVRHSDCKKQELQLEIIKVRKLPTALTARFVPPFIMYTQTCLYHTAHTKYMAALCTSAAQQARSRDTELSLEKVERGETDADAYRSLDPVHAQTLEQSCHALFCEHRLRGCCEKQGGKRPGVVKKHALSWVACLSANLSVCVRIAERVRLR